MTTNVYKITMYVIDFDDLGESCVKSVIENSKYANHCISPIVMSIETREVQWSDDHPLNRADACGEEITRMFAEIGKVKS